MIKIKQVTNNEDYIAVCDILRKSQKSESSKTGVLYNTIGLTPEQLAKELQDHNGKCFCSYEGDTITGTLSVFLDEKKKWYSSDGICLTIKYVGVSPEHQGKHIASYMIEYIKKELDYQMLSVSTGEKNKHAIHLYEKNGFILVDMSRGVFNNAYKMAYWKNGCPISSVQIKYHLSKARTKCLIKKIISKSDADPEQFK